MEPSGQPLAVAVTGPTGTFGAGLLPRLEADDRIGRVVGVARRPFDPARRGWSKMEYRQGDVRDQSMLRRAFEGVDVVVHLAFLITGTAQRAVTEAVNVDGTLHTFRAAAAAGAKRFVYASSVAAYGFHPDNPIGMTEDWPVRPAAHLFYAREKAELERLLEDQSARHPEVDLYVLRPPVVLGPHAIGAKELLPPRLEPIGRVAGRLANRVPLPFPVPLPVFAPDLLLQLVHEDDVGSAFLRCIVGAGPPGRYNIAGDGVLTVADVVRELGFTPIPIPARPLQVAARALASMGDVPVMPPAVAWAEAMSHPAIMDTTRAKRELGWRPQYTGIEALRATLEARR